MNNSNSINNECGRTWYCAGPFWDDKCRKFFDEFKSRIEETSMDNIEYSSDLEPHLICRDQVFMPGHYEVNFPLIKKEFDSSSFRRVLTQVLHLDLTGMDKNNLLVYVPGYDLGTMFEVGYFIAHHIHPTQSRSYNYNILRKSMILHESDGTMNTAIDDLIDAIYELSNDIGILDDSKDNSIALVDNQIIRNSSSPISALAILLDSSANSPFNSMMAGVAYALDIPFITMSFNDTKSNTMMLGASLGHIKTTPTESIKDVYNFYKNLKVHVWSDDNINYAKDIK